MVPSVSSFAMAQAGKREPGTVQNRKASFNYEISDQLEAGIVLVGSEVKSLFLGRANLTDAYCRVTNGELWLHQMDIEPYEKSSHYRVERRRERKLLAHRKEIELLRRKQDENGLSLVPLKVYFKGGKAKVVVGVGKGKKQYDKREAIKKKETRRELERELG
ncbi:MAG: SsrA-binding protein SmpB [Fimbriimonadaceae bacterium]|nr:SsrA-binding protein SmpB [Fimbriimonadaceae bacterium]